MNTTRIYLDNAATSFPKPDSVVEAVTRYLTECGVAAGRGNSRQSAELDGKIAACRAAVARLLGATKPSEVVFTFNGTDSLNLAIHGCLRPGDHVVTTELEHNSVLRPLRDWEVRHGVTVTYLPPDANGRISPESVQAALRSNTRLVAVTHASNVTGVVQPIREIGEILEQHRAGHPFEVRESGPSPRGEMEQMSARSDLLYLVDAAQTAGHIPIHVDLSRIDLLGCSGHKGLLGPLGTGVTYIREAIRDQIHPLRQGGTGSQSESLDQPSAAPDKYESGNPNAAGLVGLAAALEWIEGRGVGTLRDRSQGLLAGLHEGLTANPKVRVVSPDPRLVENAGVISFVVDHLDPRVAASVLEGHFGIEVRAGLHCAPLVHRGLGTNESGGTIRASVGPFSTEADVDALCTALLMVATAM